MNILIPSFRQSLKSLPFVFKAISLYFGFYFIAFVVAVSYLFPSEMASVRLDLNLLVDLALVFMVPYYTYKHSKNTYIRPFWVFVRKTFWPVVWNLYIRTTLIVFFFSLLLVIPGLYKLVRLAFVNETIFFDNLYKQDELSSLKGSDKTSRGYFWPVFLVSIVTMVFFGFTVLAPLLIKTYLSVPLFVSQILVPVISFYVHCFLLLFYTQLYFEIKKQKGEDISF